MREWIGLLFCGVIFLYAGANAVFSQFKPEESAQRSEIEDLLIKAEIVRSEKVGVGVTKPIRIYLRRGDQEISGIWKNPGRRDPDFSEGWRHEIAAYKLDVLLGLELVPPTVERRFRMRKGSFQYWVDGLTTQLRLRDEGREIPIERQDHCDRMQCLANAFDSLIANIDRTQENIAYTKDWRVILLDHSRSFRTHRFYVEKLMYGDQGMNRKPIAPLPRGFVVRIRELNFETIREAVGPYLNAKEIRAVLKRRDLLVAEIDDQIRKHGEEAVLYD